MYFQESKFNYTKIISILRLSLMLSLFTGLNGLYATHTEINSKKILKYKQQAAMFFNQGRLLDEITVRLKIVQINPSFKNLYTLIHVLLLAKECEEAVKQLNRYALSINLQ